MRVKLVAIVLLCVMIVGIGSGCRKGPATGVDITDPAELEKLWQEYFYPAIASVGNTEQFDSAAAIDPLQVAVFCWFKYVDEHGTSGLTPTTPGSSEFFFPDDSAMPYAERYFNLKSLDFSKIESPVYDSTKGGFAFAMQLGKTRPAYNADNSWGYKLTKATRNKDTVTVVLSQFGQVAGRTLSTMTFTMKQRKDGSLYFVSGKHEYVNNHLVTLTGDYQRFDGIKGFDDSMDALYMLGEAGGKLVLVHAIRGITTSLDLMLVDPKTMTVEKRFPVNGTEDPTDAYLTQSGIVVRLTDKVVIVDTSLSRSEEVALPGAITDEIGLNSFRGYDVAANRQTFVYANDFGVTLVDTAANRVVTLFQNEPGGGVLNSAPRFVANGELLVTTLIGYGGPVGYTAYDLVTDNRATYMFAGGMSTDFIRTDSGLLEVNAWMNNNQSGPGFYATMYLDFSNNEARQVELLDKGDAGPFPPFDYTYVGKTKAAFITEKRDKNDDAKNKFFINRLTPGTMKLEPSVITVTAAETRILGVLDDGRIVFWYRYNAAEQGICITK